MTREDAKIGLEIIKAFADGKEIQWKAKNNDEWFTEESFGFDFKCNDYRIKPEDIYRPYKNTEEMVSDYCKKVYPNMQKDFTMFMPCIWVLGKETKVKRLISAFYHDKNEIEMCGFILSLDDIFAKYTYLDGTPIGVKV